MEAYNRTVGNLHCHSQIHGALSLQIIMEEQHSPPWFQVELSIYNWGTLTWIGISLVGCRERKNPDMSFSSMSLSHLWDEVYGHMGQKVWAGLRWSVLSYGLYIALGSHTFIFANIWWKSAHTIAWLKTHFLFFHSNDNAINVSIMIIADRARGKGASRGRHGLQYMKLKMPRAQFHRPNISNSVL